MWGASLLLLVLAAACGAQTPRDLTIEAFCGASGLSGELIIALHTLNDTMHVTLSAHGLSSEESGTLRAMVEPSLVRLRPLAA